MISVIIPCSNPKGDLLRRAIESIAIQSYKDLEIVICSDNNTIEVLEQIRQIANEFSDLSIKVTENRKKRGISNARNQAATVSSGEWLVWLDHDDTLDKQCLEMLLNNAVFEKKNYVIGKCNCISENVSCIKSSKKYYEMYRKYKKTKSDPFLTHVVAIQPQMINKQVFLEMGGFNPEYKKAELTEFFLKYLWLYGEDSLFFCEDAIYNYYRIYEGTVSSNREQLFNYRKKALLEYARKMNIDIDDIVYLGKKSEDGAQLYLGIKNGYLQIPEYAISSLKNMDIIVV